MNHTEQTFECLQNARIRCLNIITYCNYTHCNLCELGYQIRTMMVLDLMRTSKISFNQFVNWILYAKIPQHVTPGGYSSCRLKRLEKN